MGKQTQEETKKLIRDNQTQNDDFHHNDNEMTLIVKTISFYLFFFQVWNENSTQ